MADIRLYLEEADGGLPAICMCCGGDATVTKVRKMSWCPPWVNALIFAGWLPYLIVAMILTKRATVQVPLCDQHQGHWFNRNLLVGGSFAFFTLIGLVAFGLMFALDLNPRAVDDLMGFVCLGTAGLFLVW